jgi:uncharacterized lipoprotein YddW (UPF0748 family)
MFFTINYNKLQEFRGQPAALVHCIYQSLITFAAMRCYSIIVLLLAVFTVTSYARAPKREFRAAWIATVSNIDWPSKPGLPSQNQQEEFSKRLDQLQALGCNAVVVQIRPASDAFYKSPYEPWSRFLTGRQGQPPFPNYDPLEFMIEEAHKRNMEFHAWFNPFRALTDAKKNPNPADHVTRRHPDWVVVHGGKGILNPGLPQVREYVINVITDVVKRYDIDGIHIDDYFYPYTIAGVEFNDAAAYNKYKEQFTNKGDWRRNNVNLFISTLGNNMRNLKPYVKLGISPFGVWRNASKDPEGSATRGGQTCYDDLCADVVLWMKKGWIDYLVPQLYWEHGHRAAPFDILLPWWEGQRYNRHIYYGLGVYRMLDATKPPWNSTKELLWQVKDIRETTATPGYVLYSTSNFDKIRLPIADSITKYNATYALPPLMPWKDTIAPASPTLKAIPSAQGTLLKWSGTNPSREPLRFAVYRFTNDEKINLDKAENIINILQGTEFLDKSANKFKQCKYVVTALDRLWNESKPSNMEQTNSSQ